MGDKRLYLLIVDMGYRERTGAHMFIPFVDDRPGSGPSMRLYTGEEIEKMRQTHQLKEFEWILIDAATMDVNVS